MLNYLDLATTDPAWNLAVEEYVFDRLPKDRMYLLLWQNHNAIIVGKHQNTLAQINEALKAAGVVPDFRYPNVIRLAPQPLYNRYVDVYDLVQILKTIMDTGAHLKYENKAGTVA